MDGWIDCKDYLHRDTKGTLMQPKQHLSIHPSAYPSILSQPSLAQHILFYLSILSINLFVSIYHLFVSSIDPAMHMAIHPAIYLSSISPAIYTFTYPSNHLSIHLSNDLLYYLGTKAPRAHSYTGVCMDGQTSQISYISQETALGDIRGTKSACSECPELDTGELRAAITITAPRAHKDTKATKA